MYPIGLFILVQPAMLLLSLGASMIATGVAYVAVFRHVRRRFRPIASIICLLAFVAISLLGFYNSTGIPPVSLEFVNSLQAR